MRLPRLLLGVLPFLLAGCSMLGNTDPSPGPSRFPMPEKTKVTVATLPTADQVSLHLAIRAGYFADVGLDVTTVNGHTKVSALRSSSVQHIGDMAGKRVAITAKDTMSQFMVEAACKYAGVDWRTIHWVAMGFPEMTPALERGEVDAAYLVEPWIQVAATALPHGAVPLFDTAPANGPTAALPLTGYGARADVVAQNPRTVAAFQRAMQRATATANGNPGQVEELVSETTQVGLDTVKLAQPPTFESSLSATRIQRVADLMVEFGALAAPFDVTSMIVPPPTEGGR